MGKRTGKYWQERFKQMEQAQHDTSFQKVQEIQEQFDRSLAAINAKINSWSVSYTHLTLPTNSLV